MPSSDTQFKKGDKRNIHPIFGKRNGSWKHGKATIDNLKEYFKNYNKEYNKKYGSSYNKKRYKEKDGYRDAIKNNNLLKKFGLSLKEYNQLVIKQNGLCSICKQKSIRNLAVDHNHETGAIRGLLCVRCNTGLGMFRDNVLILEEAIKYLNK